MSSVFSRTADVLWPAILGYAIVGALIAGVYGILHDQFTYSIAPEYFRNLKFQQFHWADLGFSRRVFVGEIGFLATWWVGFFAAWFIARSAVPAFPVPLARRHSLIAFGIVLGGALTGLIVGYVLGLMHGNDYSAWDDAVWALKLTDVRNFVRVAYIHNAGYLGALLGFVFAMTYLWRVTRDRRASSSHNAS